MKEPIALGTLVRCAYTYKHAYIEELEIQKHRNSYWQGVVCVELNGKQCDIIKPVEEIKINK